ncbi:MAG TPA: hypothetical protein VM184_07285 [Gaiellaceae bacterium]|nr:hypothetical protein [Gaiellaceae bacterium]
MGPDGDLRFTAGAPAVAYDSHARRYLVVWAGRDGSGDREIWGRLVSARGRPLGSQFRISDMGGPGERRQQAASPAVAYNPIAGEYLVVWSGDGKTRGDYEIFAQRLDALGREIGDDDFRISRMGADRDTRFGAFVPDVAFNPRRNEYLVVWRGDDGSGSLVDGEWEIFAQRLSADGSPIAANGERISDAGPDGDTRFGAGFPSVAYNATDDEYLVVWAADDTGVDNEFEIFGQRLDGAGREVGENDFRVSDVGPAGDPRFGARTPRVAYGSSRNEYLVVWWGDDAADGLVEGEFEVFGQRLSAGGRKVGTEGFRISRMGAEGEPGFAALVPSLAYGLAGREFVVAWYGDTGEPPLEDNELEIYVASVPEGGAAPSEAIRVSYMGRDGKYLFAAVDPAVAYN